jgi:hypothetical protein
MRKNLIAVAAAAALTAATATTALAQHHRGAPMGGGRAGVSANIGGAPRGNFVRPGGNFAPNRNFAAGGWNNNWNGGWNRGWNTGWNSGWRRGPGWRTTLAFGGGPLIYNFAGGNCWQRRPVPTPFGLQWRLVNVCGW